MIKERDIDKKESGKATPKKQVTKSPKPVLVKNSPAKQASQKKVTSIKTVSAVKKIAGEGSAKKNGTYFEAIGRRKTAIARVRLYGDKEGSFIVNGKPINKYFLTKELERIVKSPFDKIQDESGYSVTVIVKGGGIHAQAEAIRHGISRSLVDINEDHRKRLRGAGFLTRDSRMRERKKFGLRRARRAPQFSKR